MRYIITEKQLKRLTENEMEIKFVYVILDLPTPSEVSRESHPHLFKTKYTDDGHPIPIKGKPSISKVVLKNKDTDFIYGVRYPETKIGDQGMTLTGIHGPDGEIYTLVACNKNGLLVCLGHIDKTLIHSVRDIDYEMGISGDPQKLYNQLKEKNNVVELVAEEETT